MPQYRITDPATGRVVTVRGDQPPTQEDSAKIFASLAAPAEEAPEMSSRDSAVGALESVGQGLTFGFQDEASGFLGAVTEAVFGDPFEEYYKQAGVEEATFSQTMADYTQASRDRQKQYAAENPVSAAVLEGVGMIATGVLTGGATMAVSSAMTNAARVSQGTAKALAAAGASSRVSQGAGQAVATGTSLGLLGGAEAGLYGFGVGEGGLAKRLESAGEFAKMGAAVGGALGVAGSAGAQAYKARKAQKGATANRVALEEKTIKLMSEDPSIASPTAAAQRAAEDLGMTADDVALLETNAPLRLPQNAQEAQTLQAAIAARNTELLESPTKLQRAGKVVDKAIGQIRTRVGGIMPQAARLLNDVETESMGRLSKYAERMSDLRLIDSLPSDTVEALKISLRLGDREAVNQTLDLFPKIAAKVKPQLDDWFDNISKEMYDDGVGLGLFREGEEIANYFPAVVKPERLEKLQEVLYGTVPKSTIEASKEAYAKQLGIKVKDLTKEQIDELYIEAGRGRVFSTRVEGLKRPGFTRERTLDNITTRLSEYYEDPVSAMNSYLHKAVDEAAFRRQFGLHKLVTQRIKGKEAIAARRGEPSGKQGLDTNIRSLLEQRIDQMDGTLPLAQKKELLDLLEARFLARNSAPHKSLQHLQNLSSAFALGHLKSTYLQIADVLGSGFHNGVGNTAKAIGHALLPNRANVWKTADVGLDNVITADLASSSAGVTRKLADASLKYSGFRGMDKIGKSVHLNALHNRFSAMAKNSKQWEKLSKSVAGEYSDAEMLLLRKEFQQGFTGSTASPLMKSFMMRNIMDRLPISKSNMTELWARHPNARFMYQLKSFGLQQVDLYRRNFYRELKKGNTEDAVKYLLGFTASIGGVNALVDESRRIAFQDKPLEYAVDDLPENFAWQSLMLMTAIGSPHLLRTIERDGVGTAALGVITPPALTLVADAISKDAAKLASKGVPEDISELSLVQRFPLLGDPLRYWIGEGGERWERDR